MIDSELPDIQILRNKINNTSIYRVPPKSKEMPAMGGGGYYSWQFYLRNSLLDPKSLETIALDFWNRFEATYKIQPFQIAGVEAAAVPIITAIILKGFHLGVSVNAFTIRKTRKDYGRRNIIEGNPNELPVLFVDDLTSPQHSAFWHAVHVLSSYNLALTEDAYVIVRKQLRNISPFIETSIGTVLVQSMFTLDDFDLEYNTYNNPPKLKLA